MKWINVTDGLPAKDQNVLIDTGGEESVPAQFDGESFRRYPNHVNGDRCKSYHYTGVVKWMGLPKTTGK